MTTTPRLRDQPATLRPRVVIRDGKFWVEYYGPHVREVCGNARYTFKGAIDYANDVAKRHEPWLKRAAA